MSGPQSSVSLYSLQSRGAAASSGVHLIEKPIHQHWE